LKRLHKPTQTLMVVDSAKPALVDIDFYDSS